MLVFFKKKRNECLTASLEVKGAQLRSKSVANGG